MTLVDSKILLDFFTRTPDWWKWALVQLEDAALHGPLLINDVIYAETSVRFQGVDDFDAALAVAGITVAPISRKALFLAGKAFARYRAEAAPGPGCCPTSLSARMPRSSNCRY